MTNTKKRIIGYIFIGLATILIFGLVITMSPGGRTETVAELLSLGERFLLEMNYEQALVQFLRVIEIEPMNARGYTGAAQALIGLGDIDGAIAILRQGYELTGDGSIREMLERLTNSGAVETDSPAPGTPAQPGHPAPVDAATNLTDQPPFSLADLEEWGFLRGLDAYNLGSLVDRGLIYLCVSVFDIYDRRFEQNGGAGFQGRGWMFVQFQNPGRLIRWVNIQYPPMVGGYSMPFTATGPRGLSLGMTIYEALNLFRCDNHEALEFARNPVPLSYTDTIHVYLYSNPQNPTIIRSGGHLRGEDYRGDFLLSYSIHDDNGQLIVLMQILADADGIITEIDVRYFYGD